MFTTLRSRPQNPRHFIALCFLTAKDDPSFKNNNKLLKKVAEHNNVAIFQCAYGFFAANKKQQFSDEFHLDLNVLKEKLKMPLPKKKGGGFDFRCSRVNIEGMDLGIIPSSSFFNRCIL